MIGPGRSRVYRGSPPENPEVELRRSGANPMGFVAPVRDDLGMSTSQVGPAQPLEGRRGFLGTGIRRSSDRIVGGVAAGLADHLRVQRMVVRVGFVLLSVCGGAGL